MSNEVTLSSSMTYQKGNALMPGRNYFASRDVAATGYVSSVMVVTTTPTAIDIGSLPSIGIIMLKNLAPLLVGNPEVPNTAYIEITADAGGVTYPIKMLPGDFCQARWNTSVLKARVSSGTADLEYTIFPI